MPVYDPEEKERRAVRDERNAEADVSTMVELWEKTYRPLTIDERLKLYDHPFMERIMELKLTKQELEKCVTQSRKLEEIYTLGVEVKANR
jgi:hypothetical protein